MKPLLDRHALDTSSGAATEASLRADRHPGLFEWAIVDLFAGAGGASLGIERAFTKAGFRDRFVDLMVNHWDVAVGVHQANHPMTEHLRCSVWEVNPEAVLLGRRILQLHLSPDCADFSKAKGGAPKRKHIRALADVGLVWAEKRWPVVITLENVEEFRDWGPLMHKRLHRNRWAWTRRPAGKDKPVTMKGGPKMGTPEAEAFIARHEKAKASVEPFLCPDPAKRGQEFRRWKKHLEDLGYVVDVRELRACDYGTPTTRKRLFVLARCDGRKVVWPEKTHGKDTGSNVTQGSRNEGRISHAHQGGTTSGDRVGGVDGGRLRCPGSPGEKLSRGAGNPGQRSATALKPFRTAAECLDFDRPMLSIFATKAEARAWAKRINLGRPSTLDIKARRWARRQGHSLPKHERVGVPQRPLKPKTHARLAGGLFKHVLAAAEPFIVNLENWGWNAQTRSVDEPLSTVTANPKGGKHALCDVEVNPPRGSGLSGTFLSTLNHGGDDTRSSSPDAPISTITGANDARAVVGVDLAPYTIPRYGERDGQAPRSGSVNAPAPTITPTGNGAGLVAVSIARFNGEKSAGEARGQGVESPISTLDTQNRFAVVGAEIAPFKVGCGGSGYAAKPTRVDQPAGTVMVNDRQAIVAAHVVKFRGDSVGTPVSEPAPTITSGQGSARDAGAAHAMGLSAVYLSHMYTSNSNGGQGDPAKPLNTITSGGQHAKVCCVFLSPYYGNSKDGATPAEPAPTVVGKDRFGLVSVDTVPASEGGDAVAESPHWVFTPAGLRRARQVAKWAIKHLKEKVKPYLLWVTDGTSPRAGTRFPLLSLSIKGALYLVTDIAIRMLRARELARCQGFPDDYVIDHYVDRDTGALRRLSNADQVKLIGNSVPPDFMEAITRANVVDLLRMDPSEVGGLLVGGGA